MKLIEISLKNFRQFYGEQKIEFSTGNENITIIFGENGKGKTGIFRALMFGLYGSTHIQQDNPKEKIHLVNFKKMEENLNLPVDAYVQIIFEYKEKRYQIKRELQGFRTAHDITERVSGVELTIIDENGNYGSESITDENEIKLRMNDILHENIKDFFLFDAEKIETLTKTDAKVKAEVKTGIVKLLQIDKLESAIHLLKRLHASEKKKVLANVQNLDLTHMQNQIDSIAKLIEDLEEKLQYKEEDQIACHKEINDIEEKLSENEEVRQIQEKYDGEKEKKNLQVRLSQEKKGEIKKDLISNGYHLLMKDTYVSVNQYLDQILVDQKDLVPFEVIEKSLKDGVCACCNNDLKTHIDNLKYVELLKNNYKRSELTPLISMIKSSIHDFEMEEDEFVQNLNKKLVEFREMKDDIETINKVLDRYKQDIADKAQEQENLKHLELTLKDKKNHLFQVGVEIEGLKTQIAEKEKERVELDKKFAQMMRDNESLRIDSKVMDYITDLKEHFEKVFKEYSDEMRMKLTKEATEIFKLLIDRKDKELIKKIDINSKYEIDIIGWDNVNITQDISQGQRQVVALSFISALAKVASGSSSEINFPLFMDTPFGRISGNNRDHLIDNIPNLTSQWILLLTDTELSKTEEIKFKSTGKLGKWYRLDQISPGHSQIIPVEINEAMATRG